MMQGINQMRNPAPPDKTHNKYKAYSETYEKCFRIILHIHKTFGSDKHTSEKNQRQ